MPTNYKILNFFNRTNIPCFRCKLETEPVMFKVTKEGHSAEFFCSKCFHLIQGKFK